MKIRGLSATGIRDFLQCNLKIVFRYDREMPSIKNDHAKIGIAVHEALEQFTLRMMNKKSFPDASDYEFATNVFMNCATAEGLENMGFYSDGRIMIQEFIDRFDPAEEVLEVENFFKIKTPDDVPIVGAIDKTVKLNDDTIAIIDYKTARNALNNWELTNDIQLSMYDLAASIMWPEYKNRVLIIDYVRINKKVSTYRTEDQRNEFREFLVSIWSRINMLEEEDMKARLNRLCGWCDYQNYCPDYANYMQVREPTMPALTDMTDEAFLEHWVKVADKKSILEARQRELKMIANMRFMEGANISAAGKELYSTQAARTNYELSDVVDIIPQEDIQEVLAVNKAKLDRYVRERPELKTPLDRIAKTSFNAPIFKVREVEVEETSDSTKQNESAA